MKIVIYEDGSFANFYPLVYLRPIFDLRCGVFTLREKIAKKFPDCSIYLEPRGLLTDVVAEKYGAESLADLTGINDDVLLVNARAILTDAPGAYGEVEGAARAPSGEVIWAFVRADTLSDLGGETAAQLAESVADRCGADETDDVLLEYPWDLVLRNAEEIQADFAHYAEKAGQHELHPQVAVEGSQEDLFVADDAEVQPFTYIDCREGPVIIEKGVTVRAHSSIEGPAYIGPDTQLMEAKVREGSSLGPVCRAGGEIEESIMHGYANKYHTGFLGHSYVCPWVNLGALTTNSDLKNDYSEVSVRLNDEPMKTGSMKVGAFIGDHTKTSIGTTFNTGTMVGIMCNLVSGGTVLPKFIPSFAWYLNNRISKGLGLKYALKTARTVMGRRDVELTDSMVELIEKTEEMTQEKKMEKVRRDRKKVK